MRRWRKRMGWAMAVVVLAGTAWAAQPPPRKPAPQPAPPPPPQSAPAPPPAAAPIAPAPQASPDAPKLPDTGMVAEAHFELGLMYHERVFDSLDQAIAEYEKAIQAKPDYAEAHYHLGLSYHTKAKLGTDDKALYRKAIAEYKLYLKYAPNGELAEKAKQNIRVVETRLR